MPMRKMLERTLGKLLHSPVAESFALKIYPQMFMPILKAQLTMVKPMRRQEQYSFPFEYFSAHFMPQRYERSITMISYQQPIIYLPHDEDIRENLRKVGVVIDEVIAQLKGQEEDNQSDHKFREEKPLIYYLGHSIRRNKHYHYHQCAKHQQGQGNPINHRGRYAIELLSHSQTTDTIGEHLHEELPFPQHIHGEIDKENEGEVYDRVHEFDEGDPSDQLVSGLRELLAAELQAAAGATDYHLIYHPYAIFNQLAKGKLTINFASYTPITMIQYSI